MLIQERLMLYTGASAGLVSAVLCSNSWRKFQTHQTHTHTNKTLAPVSSISYLYPPSQDCGADCAKFQKSELEYKFNKKALERPYTSKHSWGKTYGEHKRHLEFSHDQYRDLQKYAEEVGIFFTASGMDEVRNLSILIKKSPL